MQFIRPVLVGDEVSLYADVTHVGRTSMKIMVRAFRRARAESLSEEVTSGTFTFVAIDEQRRPRVVPAE
jgi:acyl-CoA thioesterase YciA